MYAVAAARFYAETFPDSTVGAIHRAPSDYPSGKKRMRESMSCGPDRSPVPRLERCRIPRETRRPSGPGATVG